MISSTFEEVGLTRLTRPTTPRQVMIVMPSLTPSSVPRSSVIAWTNGEGSRAITRTGSSSPVPARCFKPSRFRRSRFSTSSSRSRAISAWSRSISSRYWSFWRESSVIRRTTEATSSACPNALETLAWSGSSSREPIASTSRAGPGASITAPTAPSSSTTKIHDRDRRRAGATRAIRTPDPRLCLAALDSRQGERAG